MLAKLTSKNQITIPKEILSRLEKVAYFDVEYKEGAIILKPVRAFATNLEKVREKIRNLGLSEDCVEDAVKWARSK
jgi:bifunctional DNA-binding transcriptional regulator/antitoxin component of YhaV-PrlF toxin-antitoxin module